MRCRKYQVFEYDEFDVPHDTGKSFFISLQESNKIMKTVFGYDTLDYIDDRAVQMAFFSKVFGFDKQSGYYPYPAGDGMLDITWRVKTWRLIKAF